MTPLKHDEFVVAISCMDGRIQRAVLNYIKQTYGTGYVDLITDIGPNRILAEKRASFRHGKKSFLDGIWAKFMIASIKERLAVSVKKHGSKLFFIVGHGCCAGNTAHKQAQIVHLHEAKKTVDSFGFSKKIILLWVEQDWKTVEEIK
jgi:hypothetical protein